MLGVSVLVDSHVTNTILLYISIIDQAPAEGSTLAYNCSRVQAQYPPDVVTEV